MLKIWDLNLDLDMVTGLCYTNDLNFNCILNLKVQITSLSFKSWFGALEDTRGSWMGFGILILIQILSLIFNTTMFLILALSLDFEGTKNIHILEALIRGHSRFLTQLGFWILILIWIRSCVFDTMLCWVLDLYLDSEGATNIFVLIWGFRGCWRFLTGGWHLDTVWI